jgi:hypothetical protein
MAASRYHSAVNHPEITRLKESISDVRQNVITHKIYTSLHTPQDVAVFMEHHVFAVWDFMSLLKQLQNQLTCTRVPWVPDGPVASRRLINEITLVEESDELGDSFISHFELYRAGMADAGAETAAIDGFIALLRDEVSVPEALVKAGVPQPSATFVSATWDVIEQSPVHSQAAVFAFGREDLIPDMFEQVVRISDPDGTLSTFKDYLVRHIEVDADEHTPMAMHMLVDLCGDDQAKWDQCALAVRATLTERARLWSAITAAITERAE